MEVILNLSNDNNSIQTMTEILKTPMIKHKGNSNWFNGPIINLFGYTRLIIAVLSSDNFYQYLIKMENTIKQFLEGLKYKLKCFFYKIYKIRAPVIILRLFRLIHDNSSLDLIQTQFCINSWFKIQENLCLQNLRLLIYSLSKYLVIKRIIKTLAIMMFCLPQDNKLSLEASDFIIEKEKLVVIMTNPLVCYLFLKLYLL